MSVTSAATGYEQAGELKIGQVGIANLRIRTLDVAQLVQEMHERVQRAPKLFGRAAVIVDFGGLRDLRKRLEDTFDHKTVVAADDPNLDWFRAGHDLDVLDLVVLPDVGCEKYAEYAGRLAVEWLAEHGLDGRVRLVSCEVREHGANGASWTP